MICEQHLVDILSAYNFDVINDKADMYNAERLKEYCNWFYRRNMSSLIEKDNDIMS